MSGALPPQTTFCFSLLPLLFPPFPEEFSVNLNFGTVVERRCHGELAAAGHPLRLSQNLTGPTSQPGWGRGGRGV